MPDLNVTGVQCAWIRRSAVFFALILAGCGLAMNSAERLDRATAAYESGDFRAAIIDAKDVLRKEPDNLRGRILLGRASLATGDGASAEKEFDRAIELGAPASDMSVDLGLALLQQRKYRDVVNRISPDAATNDSEKTVLLEYHGRALLGLGRSEASRELFDLALQLDPDNVTAKLGIVASHEHDQNFAQARASLSEIVTAHPDDVRGWTASGELNLRTGNFEAAKANFDVALGLANEQQNQAAIGRALAGLAKQSFAAGDIDGGRSIVEQLLEVAPNSLSGLLLQARVAYLDRDWPVAQQNLQRILQVAPENIEAKFWLGAVHLASGNLSQAEMYLSTVVASMPDNRAARQMLADTKMQLRKLDDARQTLEPIIEGPNADVRSLAMAASTSVRLGDFEGAIDYLERSLQTNPDNVDLQFQLVVTYLSAGRSADAERALNAIAVNDDSDGEFRRDVLLVLTQLRSGDKNAALTDARSVVQKWPQRSHAHLLLGSTHLALGDSAAARSSIEKAAELADYDVTSLRYLASINEADGDYAAARKNYESILQADPESAWAMMALARLGARSSDTAEAARWLEKIRTSDPQALAPRAMLARLYTYEKNFDQAVTVVNEAIALDPSIAELHDLYGNALYAKGDFRGAANSFRRASDLDAQNMDYRVNYARAQQRLGNAPLALQSLDDSRDKVLQHLPAALALTGLLLETGDLDEARAVVDELKTLHAESPAPWALQGEIHMRDGNLLKASQSYDLALQKGLERNYVLRAHGIKQQLGLADARQPLQQYLEVRPLDTEVRMVLAESYREAEDLRSAISEYQSIVAGEPDNAIILNNLAWVYFLANDAKAEATARKAHELKPDIGAIADTLGWILVNTGSVEEGVEILRKASAMEKGRAEVRYHLAEGLMKAGQKSEARKVLTEILARDETFASRDKAQQLLGQL